MTTQALAINFLHSASDAVSSAWETAQKCVGVQQNASTTEKVVRVYNATVATLVTAAWVNEIGNAVVNYESSPGSYEGIWRVMMICFATGEYLSDAAFHAVASQVSENSSTELKVAAVSLDLFRLGLIGKLELAQSPFSTIPAFLNYTDIFNHVVNIAYNTGQLSKIEQLFCEKAHKK